jgi:hypothetical protein
MSHFLWRERRVPGSVERRLNMKTYTDFTEHCHPKFQPHSRDLHCAATREPSTPAGRYLARRYDVPTSIADVVAGLAGLGLNEGVQ